MVVTKHPLAFPEYVRDKPYLFGKFVHRKLIKTYVIIFGKFSESY